MGEYIIKVDNISYAKYEELLMQKDEVKKQAFQHEREYIRVFGELILEVFKMKIESIRKKKTIEYCQIFLNKGMAVDQKALQEYLEKELAEYKKRLDEMILKNEAAKKSREITEADLLEIKRIYHRLVKKIHPDINPLASENKELNELWHRLMVAYSCNDLREMQETEILINILLEKLDLGLVDIFIPDIDEKIIELEAEIKKITTTDPYMYKAILEDPEAVKQKKEELKKKLKEYEDYGKQLDEIISGLLLQSGVTITWKMD